MRMVGALIRAGKAFDLLVLPGQPHDYSGTSASYFRETVRRYFEEHLRPSDNPPLPTANGQSKP
jgi:dipeptidyl aminopeptidase/acylaminoacyl peptidase